MVKLTNELISTIQKSVDIADVIGSYISIQKAGRSYKAVCPFHDDRDPSLNISVEKQIYKCFSCGAGGNVFTFVSEYEKISKIEAIAKVGKLVGIDIGVVNKTTEAVDPQKGKLYKVNSVTSELYNFRLFTKQGSFALEYLKSRDINRDIIDYFKIGYAPQDRKLVTYLTSNNHLQEDIVNAGLAYFDDYGNVQERFIDRIMFPISDFDGNIVGFSGRIFGETLPSEQNAKYKNSPETLVFRKGEILYNYHKAKSVGRKEGCLYLLEGFMDVIAYHKVGIENAIALMGTSLSQMQIQAIKKVSNKVILNLDGDNPGINAALKHGKQLLQAGFEVSIVVLPDESDPDEYLQNNGKEKFLEYLQTARISFIDFEINHYIQKINLNNHSDVIGYIKLIGEDLSVINEDERWLFFEKMAKKLNVSVEAISRTIKQKSVITNVNNTQTIPVNTLRKSVSKKKINKYDLAERHLIYYMLLDKKYANKYQDELGYMHNQEHRQIANLLLDYYEENPFSAMEAFAFLVEMLDNEVANKMIDIAEEKMDRKIRDITIEQYIQTVKEKSLVLERDNLKLQFSNTLDEDRRSKIGLEIAKINQQLKARKE